MLLNKESGSELRIYGCTRAASAALSHCACIVFTATIALLSRPGTSWFSWHPFFMTLGTKSRAHWILQCLCVTCAILGLAAIVYNKHLSGKPHFTSWHGLLGVIAVCAVALQSLAAVPLIYHSLAKGWSLAKLKRYHAATGLVAYLLGSGSLLLGLRSAWFTGSAGEHTWYLAAACCAFNALVVMNQVSSAYTAKKRLQS